MSETSPPTSSPSRVRTPHRRMPRPPPRARRCRSSRPPTPPRRRPASPPPRPRRRPAPSRCAWQAPYTAPSAPAGAPRLRSARPARTLRAARPVRAAAHRRLRDGPGIRTPHPGSQPARTRRGRERSHRGSRGEGRCRQDRRHHGGRRPRRRSDGRPRRCRRRASFFAQPRNGRHDRPGCRDGQQHRFGEPDHRDRGEGRAERCRPSWRRRARPAAPAWGSS